MDFDVFYEMALNRFELKGNWSPKAPSHKIDKASIGILSSDAGYRKIQRLWSKVEQTFDIYILRSKEGSQHVEVGQVTEDFVRDKLKMDIEIDENNITVIYTNNVAAEKIPMTAWTLAHRFGHSMYRSTLFRKNYGMEYAFEQMTRVMNDLYGDIGLLYGTRQINDTMKRAIHYQLGTFKSARDRNIPRIFEFYFELIAQYIITGSVKFNTKLTPINGNYGRKITPKEDENIEDTILMAQRTLNYYIDEMINEAVGKIFVM